MAGPIAVHEVIETIRAAGDYDAGEHGCAGGLEEWESLGAGLDEALDDGGEDVLARGGEGDAGEGGCALIDAGALAGHVGVEGDAAGCAGAEAAEAEELRLEAIDGPLAEELVAGPVDGGGDGGEGADGKPFAANA